MAAEKRLKFNKIKYDTYGIINSADQALGVIEKKRVGRFLHWCFMPIPVKEIGDLWFTNGCLKEISDEITRLYSLKESEK